MALKDLVHAIVVELVDHPDKVVVSERPGSDGMVLELHIASEDVGRVIGKDGRTAESIRSILAAASTKAGSRRAQLDIVVPRDATRNVRVSHRW